MRLVLIALLTIVQVGVFPPLNAPPLSMVEIHKSALPQNDRRAAMAMVLRDTKVGRCPGPVVVAQPMLAPHERAIIVSGCESSATGNAFLWIARKRPSGLQVLATSGHVQQVYVLRSATNGFKDIVVATHESAFWSDLRLIRYNGQKYALSGCAERVYDDTGRSAVPRITAVKCTELGRIPGT